MSNAQFKFGIIGVGGRGLSTLKWLWEDKKKRGDIIAIADINEYALETYEGHVKQYLGHDCLKYVDYKELLDNEDVDVVIICVPDQLHHEMALNAFNAGKHVFLEKPVGINPDQMIDIISAAKKSGKTLEVGYVLRYSPFYAKIKELIENADIGRVLTVSMLEQFFGGAQTFFRNWWRFRKNVGGVMIQKICHDLDLCYWMFGKPKAIAAFESNVEFKPGNWDSEATYCHECKNHCPYFTKPDDERKLVDHCIYNTDKTGADIADNSQLIVQFESGVNLSLGMNFFCSQGNDGRQIQVVGSKAEITGKLEEQMLRIHPRFDFSKAKTYYIETMKSASEGHGGGDKVQIMEFLDALCEGRESKAGIDSAYWSSLLVMGAQISADEGRVVQFKDLVEKYPIPE